MTRKKLCCLKPCLHYSCYELEIVTMVYTGWTDEHMYIQTDRQQIQKMSGSLRLDMVAALRSQFSVSVVAPQYQVMHS